MRQLVRLSLRLSPPHPRTRVEYRGASLGERDGAGDWSCELRARTEQGEMARWRPSPDRVSDPIDMCPIKISAPWTRPSPFVVSRCRRLDMRSPIWLVVGHLAQSGGEMMPAGKLQRCPHSGDTFGLGEWISQNFSHLPRNMLSRTQGKGGTLKDSDTRA